MSKEEISKKIKNFLINGDEDAAKKVAEEVVKTGFDLLEAINLVSAEGLKEIGEKFEKGEIFLVDLMMAGMAMKAFLKVLTPKIPKDRLAEASIGKVVIGTVYGDVHDIGKNLVANMLEISGSDVIDLGVDVSPNVFINKAEEAGAKIIAASSLMTNSMVNQEEIINILKKRDLRGKYYVIVGGGPVTVEWVKEIGADGWCRYATDVSNVCKRIIEQGAPPLKNPILIE